MDASHRPDPYGAPHFRWEFPGLRTFLPCPGLTASTPPGRETDLNLRVKIGKTDRRFTCYHRIASCGPKVRANTSPARFRAEGPKADRDTVVTPRPRAKGPRKSPIAMAPVICADLRPATHLLHRVPGPVTGSARAASVTGPGWYWLGPSARTTHLNLRSVLAKCPFKLRSGTWKATCYTCLC